MFIKNEDCITLCKLESYKNNRDEKNNIKVNKYKNLKGL